MTKLWTHPSLVHNNFYISDMRILPWQGRTVSQEKSLSRHVSGKSSADKPLPCQVSFKINVAVIVTSAIPTSHRPGFCSRYFQHHCLPFPYLLFFNAFIDLGCGLLVGPKQTDDTSPFRVQDVPILIPNHLVQLQDSVQGRRRGKECGDW